MKKRMKKWLAILFGMLCFCCFFGCDKMYIKKKVEDALNDLLPQFETTIIKIVPDAQYIRFDYTVVKKVTVKKMTVEQIEKELGYKVEIVSEVTE